MDVSAQVPRRGRPTTRGKKNIDIYVSGGRIADAKCRWIVLAAAHPLSAIARVFNHKDGSAEQQLGDVKQETQTAGERHAATQHQQQVRSSLEIRSNALKLLPRPEAPFTMNGTSRLGGCRY